MTKHHIIPTKRDVLPRWAAVGALLFIVAALAAAGITGGIIGTAAFAEVVNALMND